MPVRIYDIAKKLGIESKEVLVKAKALGITAAKVPSSSLDKITAEYLEEQLGGVRPKPEPAPAPVPEPIIITAPPPVPAPAPPAEVPPTAPGVVEMPGAPAAEISTIPMPPAPSPEVPETTLEVRAEVPSAPALP